jgi:hypothetical protein
MTAFMHSSRDRETDAEPNQELYYPLQSHQHEESSGRTKAFARNIRPSGK